MSTSPHDATGSSETGAARAWFAEFGTRTRANGFSAFPGNRTGKGTQQRGWTAFGTALPTAEQMARWVRMVPAHSVALACGLIVAIDIDAEDAAAAQHIEDCARTHIGANPLVRIGRDPRRALVYAASPGRPVTTRRLGHVEILGRGAYLIAFGLHPVTGLPYRWIGPSPADAPLRTLPVCTPERVAAFVDALADADTKIKRRPASLDELSQGSQLQDYAVHPGVEATAKYGRDASRLVIDGRDAFLRNQIFRAYAAGHTTAEEIAQEAFAWFSAGADLTRPARDGRRPWSYGDALAKARAILASGKPRPALSGGTSGIASQAGFWTPARKETFSHAVNAAGAARTLSPSAVVVSATMLTYVQGSGTAFASVATLAGRLGLTPDTIKRARRDLIRAGYWTAERVRGGRGHLAHYRPVAAVLTRGLPPPLPANGGRAVHPNNQGEEDSRPLRAGTHRPLSSRRKPA